MTGKPPPRSRQVTLMWVIPTFNDSDTNSINCAPPSRLHWAGACFPPAHPSLFQDKESKTDGSASFNRSASAAGSTIGEQLLRTNIDRIIAASPGQWSRNTVVPVSLFSDLPAPVLAKAQKEGYDGNGRKDSGKKLTGITYDGKVYLVQANVSGRTGSRGNAVACARSSILHRNANDETRKAPRQQPILYRLSPSCQSVSLRR